MANLGSNDTPIVGESFGLPSGWSLTENADGEVVIEDSGGNVVFRRDETAGEWVTDSINAESVSVTNTTTEQVGGPITSDPITSLTDGALFVSDGVLTAAEADGPEIQWVQNGLDPVSVQLDGESITVPSDEDWMVSLLGDDQFLDINQTQVSDGEGEIYHVRTIFPAETDIDASSELMLQGFDISDLDVDIVGEISPTVPDEEIWVGGLFGFSPRVNGIQFSFTNSTGTWVTLSANDDVDADTDGGRNEPWFGGVKL